MKRHSFKVTSGLLITTYTKKIEGHTLEIELDNEDDNNFIRIWYGYCNDTKSIPIYYNRNRKDLYGAALTTRISEKIIRIINDALIMHNKTRN